MKLAEETNSTYVYDETVFTRPGKHGQYLWFPDVLPLQTTELTKTELPKRDLKTLRIVEGQWAHVVAESKHSSSCHVEFHTTILQCCEDPSSVETCYCTKAESRKGTFENMKWRLRKAYAQSNSALPEKASALLAPRIGDENKPFVSLVWHVRVGDIVLNARKDYFWKIASQIAHSFHQSRVPLPRVVVLGEGGEEAVLKSFPFVKEMCHWFFNSSCLFPIMNVEESLQCMIHSDVLVTSGSSFSAVAAALRSSGIALAALPKEGVRGIYDVSENLEIAHDGTILEIDRLTNFLESHDER